MAHPTPSALRRRLRRYDEAALARFVAALWAGAGWSTAVEGHRVVATRQSPRHDRQEMVVVASPAAVARTLVRPPDDADLLVGPVDGRVARLLSARTGLRVLDAGDLRERLLYGVGDVTREHLLQEVDRRVVRTPSRRAVLASLAIGMGAVASGATTPGPGRSHDTGAGIRFEVRGPFPAPSGDGENAATDPVSDSQGGPGTATPDRAAVCDSGPRAVVEEQVGALRRKLRVHGTGDTDSAPSRGTLDVIRAEGIVLTGGGADVEPFHRARSVHVRRAERDGDRALVPVHVLTERGKAVVYEFSLARTGGGCWLVTSVRSVAGEEAS